MYRRILKLSFIFILVSTSSWAGGLPGGAMPDGFLWGSYVSAHSTEGNHANDWTLWESVPGHVVDGSTSGQACNHWELFPEDHVWMRKLGQNSVMISLEWSRIEPTRGNFDDLAIQHYKAVIESIKKNRMEPIVVLWDRTFPQWIAAYGGLEYPGVMLDFGNYAGKVAKSFGNLVDYWIPVRDPVGFASKSYKDGVYPPGKSDIAAYTKAVICLFGMHRGGWAAIKANDTIGAEGKNPCQVGIWVGMRWVRPNKNDNPLDVSLAKSYDGLSCLAFLDGIMKGDLVLTNPQHQGPKGKGNPNQGNQGLPPEPPSYDKRNADFILVGYNGLDEIRFNVLKPLFVEKVVPPGMSVDDAGQVVFPEGLTSVLLGLKKYPIPLYVNLSIADAEGTKRGAFLIDHVRQIRSALVQGSNVRGFFYDSFLSGFEFNRGFSLKRGLLNVNYEVQEREPAGGADVFTVLAKSNGANETPRKRGPRKTKISQPEPLPPQPPQ